MRFRKIHLIGGPGSGKTYIAAKISNAYNINIYALDDIFWDDSENDYKRKAPMEVRDRTLAEIVNTDSWIIEGVYYQWLGESFRRADVIIILSPSVWRRHWRILSRSIRRRFCSRQSVKKERIVDVWNLLKWNHEYDRRMLRPARELIVASHTFSAECKHQKEVFDLLNDYL